MSKRTKGKMTEPSSEKALIPALTGLGTQIFLPAPWGALAAGSTAAATAPEGRRVHAGLLSGLGQLGGQVGGGMAGAGLGYLLGKALAQAGWADKDKAPIVGMLLGGAGGALAGGGTGAYYGARYGMGE